MLTQNQLKSPSISYRPDIDGLRAIAVIGVVLFHAGLWVPGGFAGVDVFFVISGYLITQLILRELQNEEFSILTFWERRIRRILPALAVVVTAILVSGWFLSLPFHYLIIGQSTVALTLLSSNIQFWRTTDYFAPQAEENPLLHTWSLSVEEQFYLVVPLLLLGVFRLHRERSLPTLVLFCTFLGLIISEFHIRLDQAGAFYLLSSRAWELGAGCLLCFLPPVKSFSIRTAAGYLGLTLILCSFFLYDTQGVFPGASALPPVLGSAFIILSGYKESSGTRVPGLSRALGCKPLVFVGLCSYSFYLWHWPFFAFHQYIFSKPPMILVALGYIAVSFVISIASLYFVERPFRGRHSRLNQSRVFAIGGSVIFLIFVGAISIYLVSGVPARVPPEVVELDSVSGDEYMAKDRILRISDGTELRVIGQTDLDPTLLVWGDSHALASLPAIDQVFKEQGRSAIAAEKGGTAPVIDWGTFSNPTKQIEFNRAVLDYAINAKDEALTHVLLIFFWSAYVQGQNTPRGFREPPSGFADALIETTLELQRAGLKIVIFMETPIFPVHVARALALHEWHKAPAPKLTYAENQFYRSVYIPIIDRIRKRVPDIEIFDPQSIFLGEDDEFEILDTNGRLLFRDQSHLTKWGAMRLKPALIDLFFDL
jgi:peptidoglycan/LPS O-acetylase OafA/YrhL